MPKITAATLGEHRAETIDRLLDAWGDLVLSRGYDAVSLADVALHAGLARTAIYNYFPDRESLLFAWTDRELKNTMETLQQTLAKAESSAEKMRLFVRMQLEAFTSRHLPPGKEVVQFLGPEVYKRFRDHIQPLESILRDILTQGAEHGEFAEIDADSTVSMVMACIGAERGPLSTGAHDLEEATERVATFLLRAVGARESREVDAKAAAAKAKARRTS